MGQYKISKAGNFFGGCAGYPDAIRALAQTQGRIIAAGNAGITDNSGGVADIANSSIVFPQPAIDTAVSGSNLATKANVDAALVAIQNAVATLFAKAGSVASLLGVEGVSYAGGGTNGNGTIAAISTAIAGASTGPLAANFNMAMARANVAIHTLACMVRKVQLATGTNELTFKTAVQGAITYGLGPNQLGGPSPIIVDDQPRPIESITYGTGPNFPGPGYSPAASPSVGALVTDSGAAGAPGVTAVSANLSLMMLANNIATIAAGLNTVNTTVIPALRATS